MSTKTTFKRIALVTVAALGLGLLSTVSASAIVSGTSSDGSLTATLGTATATPGVTGREIAISVPYTITAADNSDTITVGINLTAAPSTSSADTSNTYFTTQGSSSSIAAGGVSTFVKAAGVAGGSAGRAAGVRWAVTDTVTTAGTVATYNVTPTAKFYFTPDKAGTYLFSYFIDVDNTGTATSGDGINYISVTVADAPAYSVSISKIVDASYATYSTTTGTTAGTWLKLQVKDSAGASSRLNSSQAVVLTIPTGVTLVSDGTNTTSITGADYAMTTTVFDASGVAYINVTSATAGTYNLSGKVLGGGDATTTSIKFVAPTGYAVAQVTGFKDAAANAVALTPIANASSSLWASATAATVSSTQTATTIRVNAAADAVVAIRIGDTSANKFIGTGSRSIDVVATAGSDASLSTATDGSAGYASASVSVPLTLGANAGYDYKSFTANAWTAAVTAGSAVTVTGGAVSVSTAGTLSLVSPTSSTVLVAPGATITAKLKCVSNFGTAKSLAILTPTIAGRNALTPITAVITDSSGYATFTYTDASTSTTSLTDTLTFSGCTTSTTILTVNYTSTANLGVSTLTWSAGGGYGEVAAGYYEGYTETAISAGDDPSTNARKTVSFTVKDANGTPIAGVPVTFALSGNASSAIVKSSTVDYTTVYTSSTGVAAATVFAWAPGKLTVTATAGGKTATGYITFVGAAASAARVLTGKADTNVLSYKVVDRFGNPVEGVSISLSRTGGTGFFATGKTTETAVTGRDGTVDVQFNGTATVKATLPILSYPQAWDKAGEIAATAVTAAVAGLTTGTGASLAPAGVATVELSVATTSVAEANSQAAADAAAEATDAANAATDAANAAAEAADAATAAAQDAADAVAALSTQVSEMIDALKKQITALTNLVIKIQKKVKA
jgi:hypothetical protein